MSSMTTVVLWEGLFCDQNAGNFLACFGGRLSQQHGLSSEWRNRLTRVAKKARKA